MDGCSVASRDSGATLQHLAFVPRGPDGFTADVDRGAGRVNGLNFAYLPVSAVTPAGGCQSLTSSRCRPGSVTGRMPVTSCEAQAAKRWWWQRSPVVARAAHGAPAFVRPPLSPQRDGDAGCLGAGSLRSR